MLHAAIISFYTLRTASVLHIVVVVLFALHHVNGFLLTVRHVLGAARLSELWLRRRLGIDDGRSVAGVFVVDGILGVERAFPVAATAPALVGMVVVVVLVLCVLVVDDLLLNIVRLLVHKCNSARFTSDKCSANICTIHTFCGLCPFFKSIQNLAAFSNNPSAAIMKNFACKWVAITFSKNSNLTFSRAARTSSFKIAFLNFFFFLPRDTVFLIFKQ